MADTESLMAVQGPVAPVVLYTSRTPSQLDSRLYQTLKVITGLSGVAGKAKPLMPVVEPSPPSVSCSVWLLA